MDASGGVEPPPTARTDLRHYPWDERGRRVGGMEMWHARPVVPFVLQADVLDRMLNLEIADDPFYAGLEIQGFDDSRHGRGVCVFFERKPDRKIDVYYEQGLQLDPARYAIGGGLGEWVETEFQVARLSVGSDGIDAEARFTDVHGRPIVLRIADPHRRRRWATFLAPGGVAITDPDSLPLWWMTRFDLLRRGGPAPVIRIDGRDATLGRLPGERLMRRRLIKVAADLCLVYLNPADADPGTNDNEIATSDRGVETITAHAGDHPVRVRFDPPFPDLAAAPHPEGGAWQLAIDSQPIIGGTWTAARDGDDVHVGIDVTQGWRPRGLPLLMKVVTRVLPVFRTWPTTYRWRGTVHLDDTPEATGAWERTGDERGQSFRAATKSA